MLVFNEPQRNLQNQLYVDLCRYFQSQKSCVILKRTISKAFQVSARSDAPKDPMLHFARWCNDHHWKMQESEKSNQTVRILRDV